MIGSRSNHDKSYDASVLATTRSNIEGNSHDMLPPGRPKAEQSIHRDQGRNELDCADINCGGSVIGALDGWDCRKCRGCLRFQHGFVGVLVADLFRGKILGFELHRHGRRASTTERKMEFLSVSDVPIAFS